MMTLNNGYINLKDPVIRNYLGLKKEFVHFLLDNSYKLYVNFDADSASIYSPDGSDLASMTLKQLARRVKI